ncbi:MAG: ribulokinase [Candidatus Pacebacteria bacterium]|nr:ribulokinase [Candidatus Paceibacterota bacterium]
MNNNRYVIGIDYGSNSVRCVVINVVNGEECGSAVFDYPSGDAGVLTDTANPHVARQSPRDFIDGIEKSVKPALEQAAATTGFGTDRIIGIGVDTTGSTPIPVDADMTPLAFHETFKDNLNAQAWMWKDHSSMHEAEQITELARQNRPHYLAKCGGTYSSEWFFSKLLHCLNTDRKVFDAAYSWIEFADFIPAVLAGIKRPEDVKCGVCAAGHKAMYCEEWGGLPDNDFLATLNPALAELRPRLCQKAHTANESAGYLCKEYAATLGLPEGIAIACGAFDAHLGAVGAGVAEGRMVKILGTSTCDIMVAPNAQELPDIPGVCGIVDGSVLPGYYGIEAGQSAVGDIFNWFVTYVCQGNADLHANLTRKAAALKPGETGLLALDWNNGNRTILVDARLTGLLIGQTLHTQQHDIYRALIEATAFGARRILDRLSEYGVEIKEVINCGGIAEKNPLFMQIYADVMGRPMKVSASAQTCAVGSAIMGAVAAGPDKGGYATPEEAQKNICSYKDTVYTPDPDSQTTYNELYALYCQLHDSFGIKGTQFDHADVMKRLLEISQCAKSE